MKDLRMRNSILGMLLSKLKEHNIFIEKKMLTLERN